MIENISLTDLEKNKVLNESFTTSKLEDVNENCAYYSGNFF